MTVHDLLVQHTADPGHALLSLDEIAALMRVSREDVVLAIAEGDVEALIRDGVILVDGDRFWTVINPAATRAPRHLVERARLTAAPGASTVDECQAAPRSGSRKPTSSHENSSGASGTGGTTPKA